MKVRVQLMFLKIRCLKWIKQERLKSKLTAKLYRTVRTKLLLLYKQQQEDWMTSKKADNNKPKLQSQQWMSARASQCFHNLLFQIKEHQDRSNSHNLFKGMCLLWELLNKLKIQIKLNQQIQFLTVKRLNNR